MTCRVLAVVAVYAITVAGCVGMAEHQETLAELEESRKKTAETSEDYQRYKERTEASIESMQAEETRLAKELLEARGRIEQAQTDLESAQYHSANEQQARREAEVKLSQLEDDHQALTQLSGDLRRERDLLQTRVDQQKAQLERTEQSLATTGSALTKAQGRISDLEREETRLTNELLHAQSSLAQTKKALEGSEAARAAQDRRRQMAERRLAEVQEKYRRSDQVGGEIRRERDRLQTTTADLQRRLDTAEHQLETSRKTLRDTHARIEGLEGERAQAREDAEQVQALNRMLEASLAAEQAKVLALQGDKQRLLGGTTTAQEEIARLQKRAGELETNAARAAALEQQLREREREIGRLREITADRGTLEAKVATLSDELARANERVDTLTSELALQNHEAALTRQERDELANQAMTLADELEQARERRRMLKSELDATGVSLLDTTEERDALAKRLRAAETEISRLTEQGSTTEAELKLLTQSQTELARSLELEEEERARLERERLAKEAEIERLKQTHTDLSASLEAEIAKGDIRIQRVLDRLSINMVDRVLFDSGRAEIKPAGREVLTRVGNVLRSLPDKQIRIEGHTDDIPIGPKIVDRFPTNWELSTARATSVVRYLIDKSGVEQQNLSAAGYAYNRPVANNETSEGRAANRRIEIVLYPKELPVMNNSE